MNSEETQSAKTEAIIPVDVEVQGQVKSAVNIQIDGKLNGDLSCTGHAVIGSSAVINGNMTVGSIVVSGHVRGNISAAERIDLKATAKLTGDIKAKKLTVEEGAAFVGKSEVNPSGPASTALESGDSTEADAGDGATVAHAEGDGSAKYYSSAESQEQKKNRSGILFGRK